MSDIETIIDNLNFMEDKYMGRFTERISLGIMAHDCRCVIENLLAENIELAADRDNWRKTAEGHRNFTDELRNKIKKKDAEIARLTEIIRNKHKRHEKYCVSINYGIINPFFAILWHVIGNSAEIIDSYYYDSRKSGCLMGDEDYYKKVKNLIGNYLIDYISVDPSAASFIECIKRHGEYVVKNRSW